MHVLKQPKLTIELVPQTCWYSNVRSNVSKQDWDKLKKMTAQKADRQCEVCSGRGPRWPVECHEIWDYDDQRKNQTLVGLIALCPACHEVKHIGLASVKGRLEKATQHLAQINGWETQETKRYIEKQFGIWEERSQHQWTLNISWLAQFGIKPLKTK